MNENTKLSKDRNYTREEISQMLGIKDLNTYLPNKGGQTLAIRLSKALHPRAPEEIYVGKRKAHVAQADVLATTKKSLPVFVWDAKLKSRKYVGQFKYASHTSAPAALAEANNLAVRADVVRVIKLKKVAE